MLQIYIKVHLKYRDIISDTLAHMQCSAEYLLLGNNMKSLINLNKQGSRQYALLTTTLVGDQVTSYNRLSSELRAQTTFVNFELFFFLLIPTINYDKIY